MKNLLFRKHVIVASIIAFTLFSFSSRAQDTLSNKKMKSYFYLQPNIGITQYLGDINENNFTNPDFKLGYGGVLGYQISPLFGIRGQFLKTTLYAESDKQNLKFESDLWDAALNLTLNINEIFADYNEKRFANFYIFTGAGFNSFKSTLESITPSAVINSHADRQSEFFLPVGAGVSFRLSYNLAINLEYGDHICFNSKAIDFTDGEYKNDHYTYASAGLQIKLKAKDTDNDGVKDKVDLCPEIYGKAELAGCPDKDNDGIADKDDACPDVAGKAEFKGCPDTDGDGIIDTEDACPNFAGKADLNGCPDKDNDGIADKDDKCPDVAGRKELAGCPDRDGDGIIDSQDACPDVKGLLQFAGCPDTDGDGIPDNKDNCPEVAGVAANNGCPENKGPLAEKTVYFESDGSIVIDKYTIELNEIAAFMNENPDATIYVAGYADNRESVEYNLRLSEKRADYVINYLKKKGLKSLKIEKSFFGKSNPVADNNTAEGRALNRRVEIKITK